MMFEVVSAMFRRMLAPVVLDMDGDGVEYVSFAVSQVRFDMDGDGVLDRTSWVAADDAILVYDRNSNGLADNGTEIGFQTLVQGAASDLEGLAFFDTNQDLLLDADDTEFGKFSIWRDTNQNGVSEAGELQGLAAAGILRLDLQGERTGALPDGRDAVTFAISQFVRTNAVEGTIADSFFVFEPSGGTPSNPGAPGAGIETPPVEAPPALTLTASSFERKAGKYRIEAAEGSLFVRTKKGKQLTDPRAGQIGPAIVLDFNDKQIGMLAPIVFDLDGDGLDLVSSKKSRALFDMDGDGVGDDTGWVGKGDGILVIDRNADGLISAASELSFLTEDAEATSDLGALAALDSNRDRKISADDARFGELKVWVDSDRDGVSEAGELKSLTELRITEISLAARANAQTVKAGQNIVLATTTFKRSNGTTGTVGDVALAFRPSSRAATSETPSVEGRSDRAVVPSYADDQIQGLRDAMRNSFGQAESTAVAISVVAANDPDSLRIAQMVQAMAGFGATTAQADSLARTINDRDMNWFAGS